MLASTLPSSRKSFAPGATIGVLGSGQLGRMFALAARSLGYKIIIYSPEEAPPAGPVADQEFVGPYDDLVQIERFARAVDVVTFEFENVPAKTTELVSQHLAVRPSGKILHITQNRLREKTFLQSNGFPVAPFRPVENPAQLEKAIDALGVPGVLKTADFGYDGKGQTKIVEKEKAGLGWAALQGAPGVYESFVDFEKEISVVAARGHDGEFAAFPVFENRHSNHILDLTFAPAQITESLAAQAVDLAHAILDQLAVVGLLTVEMFVTRSGTLLVNELAPRTHNSGHLTIDACATSQFEQQVRAVCGLPLGSTTLRQPSAMANLLGHLWAGGEPDFSAALTDPDLKLHLYGKAHPRAGRKMGHLTRTASTIDQAIEGVLQAREKLTRKKGAVGV